MVMYVSHQAAPPVVAVRLYGVLGARFGRVHHLAVASCSEAIHALGVMIPGFRRFMRLANERGLEFAVFRGRQNVGEDELQMRSSRGDDIRIAPIVVGSKSGGLFATITGAVLVAVGLFTGMYWLAAIGAGMMLGGIAMNMAPSVQGLLGEEGDGNKSSYAFGGAVTTTAQGRCKPLLYGERDVGGALASAGIYAEDQT